MQGGDTQPLPPTQRSLVEQTQQNTVSALHFSYIQCLINHYCAAKRYRDSGWDLPKHLRLLCSMTVHVTAIKMQISVFCNQLQIPMPHQTVRYVQHYPWVIHIPDFKSRIIFSSAALKHIPNMIHNVSKNHRKGIRRKLNLKFHFFFFASKQTHFSFARWQRNWAELETIKCVEKADPEPIRLKLHEN